MAKKKTKKSSHKMLKTLICVAIVLSAVLYPKFNVLESHSENDNDNDNDRLTMELAIPQFTKSTKSQVIEHAGYTVSYNEQRHKRLGWRSLSHRKWMVLCHKACDCILYESLQLSDRDLYFSV